MSTMNPYDSPNEPSAQKMWTPADEKTIRSIRAICLLYLLFGGLGSISGAILTIGSFGDPEIPTWLPLIVFVCSTCGFVSALGVLRRKKWGVPFCQIMSALYLLSFPIGTILGAYFLLKIGKVKAEFQ